MPTFTATLLKLDEQEKSNGATLGLTGIEIPVAVTDSLKPTVKTSFRVKGSLDAHPIERVALIPRGDGEFILVVNATMRRAIRKEVGATVRVELDVDDSPMPLSADLLACLADEPNALAFFRTLAKGHQNYFSHWIESAKTTETKAKRITQAVTGLALGLGYGEMMRYFKKKNADE